MKDIPLEGLTKKELIRLIRLERCESICTFLEYLHVNCNNLSSTLMDLAKDATNENLDEEIEELVSRIYEFREFHTLSVILACLIVASEKSKDYGKVLSEIVNERYCEMGHVD